MLLMEKHTIYYFCLLQAKFFINVLAEPAEVVRIVFSCRDLSFLCGTFFEYKNIDALHSNPQASLLFLFVR